MTDKPVASKTVPEWIIDRHHASAAFVRGARPEIEVVFFMAQAMGLFYEIGGDYVVDADGPFGGIEERLVHIEWENENSAAAGMSKPFRFKLKNALPDAIGRHDLRLSWYLRQPKDDTEQRFAMGDTDHLVFTTWRRLVEDATFNSVADEEEQGLARTFYAPVVAWTSTWGP